MSKPESPLWVFVAFCLGIAFGVALTSGYYDSPPPPPPPPKPINYFGGITIRPAQ